MRWILGFVIVLIMVGCSAHKPPDDATTLTVRAGVVETLQAMAIPADQQPQSRLLDDQSRLLACRLSKERLAQLQSGALDHQAISEGYNNALKRRAAKGSTVQAPTMLVFLIEKAPQWSPSQTMLAAALLTQFEQEAKLEIQKSVVE